MNQKKYVMVAVEAKVVCAHANCPEDGERRKNTFGIHITYVFYVF